MTVYVGIDPGLRSGALAAIDSDGKFITAMNIKAIEDRIDVKWLKGAMLAIVPADQEFMICIEKVGVMPKQGIASSGRFMLAFGAIGAVAELTCKNVHYVIPQVWKKFMNVSSDKELSLKTAKELFPDAPLPLKKDHGKAEALLLAEYARRKFS